ncbi:MAG: hypothetical protein R2856_35580 [Caldilineaceae bacterium]
MISRNPLPDRSVRRPRRRVEGLHTTASERWALLVGLHIVALALDRERKQEVPVWLVAQDDQTCVRPAGQSELSA